MLNLENNLSLQDYFVLIVIGISLIFAIIYVIRHRCNSQCDNCKISDCKKRRKK